MHSCGNSSNLMIVSVLRFCADLCALLHWVVSGNNIPVNYNALRSTLSQVHIKANQILVRSNLPFEHFLSNWQLRPKTASPFHTEHKWNNLHETCHSIKIKLVCSYRTIRTNPANIKFHVCSNIRDSDDTMTAEFSELKLRKTIASGVELRIHPG